MEQITKLTILKIILLSGIGAFLLFAGVACSAQKVMQIETRGKVNTKKFYVGDELMIKLASDNFWRTATIFDIFVEDNEIDFDFGVVHLSEITALRTMAQYNRGRNWQRWLFRSGASFILYTPLELIYSDEPNYSLIAFGAALSVVGIMLRPIVNKYSLTRIGKRKRLRLLDLSFLPPE